MSNHQKSLELKHQVKLTNLAAFGCKYDRKYLRFSLDDMCVYCTVLYCTYQIAHKVEALPAVLRVEAIVVGNVNRHALGMRACADAVLTALGRLAVVVLGLAGQRDVVVEVLAPGHQQHRHRVVVKAFVLPKKRRHS